MNRLARTKIVATLGPASNTETIIRKMVMSGLNVVRLNFSHGSHASHKNNISIVRKINKKYRRTVKIMQDLEGFRIRVCRFEGTKQKELKRKSTVWLTGEPDNGDPRIIPFDYEGSLSKIVAGTLIYIDDGNIILKSKGATKTKIKAEVVEGGMLKERKGVNIPDVKIPFSGVTEQDEEDIAFGAKCKVDYVAQSFVRTYKDVETVRDLMAKNGHFCPVISKVETREAIKNIDSIIKASDGIMVARGDMGISVPIYEVAVLQKEIIRKCNEQRKFVITATQMLEHMTEHSRPTRAEVSDVTNAILDGTNYVMLSGESAAGAYPVQSVKMMDQIIKFTEAYIDAQKK